MAVYAAEQTHSTFFKACRLAGFDPANIRFIPTGPETDYALDPARLLEVMRADVEAGLVPTYVCATVGTTSSNAVDPVGAIADVAAVFKAWVHIDAAYAGSACICPEFRHHLDGVERVDSISMSPHKWLLTCLDCTCLWVRDTHRLTDSLETNPEYLKNDASESGNVTDLKDMQVGVGRRFRGLKLWMVMRTYGAAKLQEHIRSDVAMAKMFEDAVRGDDRFEVVVPRNFALVCFRIKPSTRPSLRSCRNTSLWSSNVIYSSILYSIYLFILVLRNLILCCLPKGGIIKPNKHISSKGGTIYYFLYNLKM